MIWFLRSNEVTGTLDETLFEHTNVLQIKFLTTDYNKVTIRRPGVTTN